MSVLRNGRGMLARVLQACGTPQKPCDKCERLEGGLWRRSLSGPTRLSLAFCKIFLSMLFSLLLPYYHYYYYDYYDDDYYYY